MFDTLKKVLENKPFTEQEASKVSEYIMRRWLSGDNRLIGLANTLNISPKMDNYLVLKAIAAALNGKIKFIKFPSSSKNSSTEPENLEMFSRFFMVSMEEAQEYLHWLQQHCPDEIEQVKKICKELRK